MLIGLYLGQRPLHSAYKLQKDVNRHYLASPWISLKGGFFLLGEVLIHLQEAMKEEKFLLVPTVDQLPVPIQVQV